MLNSFYCVIQLVRCLKVICATCERFRDRMDTIDEFIRTQAVPGELAERMRESLRHSWFMQQGLDVNTVLTELPENLKTSVLMHMQVVFAIITATQMLFCSNRTQVRF